MRAVPSEALHLVRQAVNAGDTAAPTANRISSFFRHSSFVIRHFSRGQAHRVARARAVFQRAFYPSLSPPAWRAAPRMPAPTRVASLLGRADVVALRSDVLLL